MSVPTPEVGQEKWQPPTWGWILFAGIFALAIVGYFVGIGPAMRAPAEIRPDLPEPSGMVVPATRWAEIKQGSLGPNTGWHTNLGMADDQARDPMKAQLAQTPAQKEQALSIRAERRAYAGAPPRTPHRVDGMSVYACQQCHGNGMSVNAGQVVAPQMPHPLYLNCLQCHETLGDQPPGGPPGGREDVASGNTFAGVAEVAHGPRFLFGAPPQIPHPTLMRTNCLSCHGPLGRQAMKTPHPDRQNCQQCHAPGAALDQRGEPVEFRTPPAVKAYIDGAK